VLVPKVTSTVLLVFFKVGVIVSEATVTDPSVPAALTVVLTVGVTDLLVPENEAVPEALVIPVTTLCVLKVGIEPVKVGAT
jgi:hypothetical protein